MWCPANYPRDSGPSSFNIFWVILYSNYIHVFMMVLCQDVLVKGYGQLLVYVSPFRRRRSFMRGIANICVWHSIFNGTRDQSILIDYVRRVCWIFFDNFNRGLRRLWILEEWLSQWWVGNCGRFNKNIYFELTTLKNKLVFFIVRRQANNMPSYIKYLLQLWPALIWQLTRDTIRNIQVVHRRLTNHNQFHQRRMENTDASSMSIKTKEQCEWCLSVNYRRV